MAPNIDKLKDKARKLELKDQPTKAIDVYLKIIESLEGTPEMDHELAIFNKVGDLYLKTNEVNNAVEMYERAALRYVESGLPNNAIALCNKILRNAPGRTATYLMLGELMLQRGFGSEAKQHFIEYAQRMSAAGRVVEAFKALKKFADASPQNQEIRSLLAERLESAIKEHPDDASLGKLYQEFTGRASTAVAAEEPPKAKTGRTSDLVFIDLDDDGSSEADGSAVQTDSPQVEPTAASGESSSIDATDLGLDRPAETLPADTDQLEPIREFEAPETPSLEVEPLGLDSNVVDESSLGDVPAVDGLTSDDELVVESLGEVDLPSEEAAAGRESSSADIPGSDDVVFVSDGHDRAGDSGDVAELDVPELDLAGFDEPDAVAGKGAESTAAADSTDDEAGKDNLEEYLRGTGAYVLDETGSDLTVETFEAFPQPDEGEVPELQVGPEKTVASFEAMIAANPDDPSVRRELAELLLEHGERDRGLDELDGALECYEKAEDWEGATSVTNEILRLEPNSIRHLQKRVEFTYRRGDNAALVPAYLGLADALFRSGAMDEARSVYERVLELDPQNANAKEGVATVGQLGAVDEEPAQAAGSTAAPAPTRPPPPRAPTPAGAPGGRESGFVDLGDLILGDEQKSTRMRGVDEQSGDEQRDFGVMLRQFKRGIEENIDEADADAHYDLGVAFKEMGLLEEAISEFQKALRSDDTRLRAAEALGMCFYEKGQLQVAATVMRRAVDADPSGDDAKIGLLYWLGRCEEEQAKPADALVYYQRAFAIDINFQDVGTRVSSLSKAER